MSEYLSNQLVWRSLDTALAIDSPHLAALNELWHDKAAGRGLPSRSDFGTAELMRFGGRIALIDIEPAPLRFRSRLVGTLLTEMLGRDSTGTYLDQLYDADKYQTAIGGYLHCMEHRRPVRATGKLVHANRDHIRFEAIDFPLAADGGTVDTIMKIGDYVWHRPDAESLPA